METEESKKESALPVLSIWMRPGQTVAALVADGKGHVGALAIATCFSILNCRRWLVLEGGDGFALNWKALPGVLLGSVAVGLVLLYLYSWLFRNFGRWMGGTGSLRGIRTGMGWGILPVTVLLACVFFIPSTVWINVAEAPDGTLTQTFNGWGFLLFAAFLYSYGVFLLSLASAHGLSALRAFATLAITFLVSIIPLSILVQSILPG